MGKELLDYDPVTCVAHYTHTHNEDKISLETKIDAEPLIERNKKYRTHGAFDEGKEGWNKYCDIDDVLILKMLKKGINILRPTESDWKGFFREIETNYPFYKVTNKKAWRPK